MEFSLVSVSHNDHVNIHQWVSRRIHYELSAVCYL